MLRAVAPDDEDALREEAISYVNAVAERSGGAVRRSELESFTFRGARVRLISPQQGIWKPKGMRAALSILTTYTPPNEARPYEDEIGADGYPRYNWRGSNPASSDNRALRVAMERHDSLIWLRGLAPGVYLPLAPVWLIAEEPANHQFVLAFDQWMVEGFREDLVSASDFDPARRYAETMTRTRLHQPVFRSRVLLAYDHRCSLCHLRHLLDAAHIKEDAEGGPPVVTNGLAMCAIHHRAFDGNVLAIRPDYHVEVAPRILEERDGPTLRYAIQGLQGKPITLPKRRLERPNKDLLEERYERFRAAS